MPYLMKYVSPVLLPSSALNPLHRHTYSHILYIFSIAFIIHCFWPSKRNGLLLCTFLSHNSNGVQYMSPKVSNCWGWFAFIYLFSNPSFLGVLCELDRRKRENGFWHPGFIIADLHGLLYNLLIDLSNKDQKITSSLVCGTLNHRLPNCCHFHQLACDW